MNIATVVSIEPTNEAPYTNEHGTFYSFLVGFDNNISGKVNAKSATGPAYKVGDVVGYEITGTHQGVNKIKVDKRAAEGQQPKRAPAAAQPQRSAPAPTAPAPKQASNPVMGVTVGMAINNAVAILIRNSEAESLPVDLPRIKGNVESIAADLISASRRLESGAVASSEDVPY